MMSPVDMNGETYFSTNEACRVLGVSRETLNRYVNRGMITRYKRGISRTAYYKKIDVTRLNDKLSQINPDMPDEE